MSLFVRPRRLLGASLFALAGFLAAAPSAQAQNAGDIMVPKFEVDPFWPKPLPNHWLMGNTIGLDVDKNDNVWVIHRPQTLEYMETYRTRGESDCCTAAPDVLAFDQAGKLVHSWGKADGHDWPTSNHGITIDKDGNVWLGGNGAEQPGPPAGSMAQFEAERNRAPGAGEGGEAGPYHDSFILKMSPDGKYLGQIGKANASKGSLDIENVKGVAQIRFLPGTNELVAADGYGNHRVSVWDATTLKNKRIWGAYGTKQPSDETIAPYNPEAKQFQNPVHCAEPTNDGLLYVCDRMNNRVQIFKFDGTFVRQFVIQPNSKGDGTPWGIAFSKDPEQKFMFVIDGTNEKIHVYDRQSEKELYTFGGGGRIAGQFYAVHNVATDSKGNLYTTETYRGQRVQKFVYKGLVPLSQLIKEGAVGNSLINP